MPRRGDEVDPDAADAEVQDAPPDAPPVGFGVGPAIREEEEEIEIEEAKNVDDDEDPNPFAPFQIPPSAD